MKIKPIKAWVRMCKNFNGEQLGYIFENEKEARNGQYPCCHVYPALITARATPKKTEQK